MQELSEVADALKQFGGDPQRADRLASILGFEPLHAPVDLLGGRATPINSFLDARFGVSELYRAGGINTGTGSVGLYIAVLGDWGARSSDRNRPRRRTARALVEYQQDARSMFIMVPNALQKRREAEFVLPRSTADLRKQSASSTIVSTVRALVSLDEPTRFHRELLCELAVRPGVSLLDISQQWQKVFSVPLEPVTRQRLLKEFKRLCDNARIMRPYKGGFHAIRRRVVTEIGESEHSDINLHRFMRWAEPRQFSILATYKKNPSRDTDRQILNNHPFVETWAEMMPYLTPLQSRYGIINNT